MVSRYHFCHRRFFYFCFFLENLQPLPGKISAVAYFRFHYFLHPHFCFIKTTTGLYSCYGRHIERLDPPGCISHHVNSRNQEKIISFLPASVMDAYYRLACCCINDLDEYHYHSAKYIRKKAISDWPLAVSFNTFSIEICPAIQQNRESFIIFGFLRLFISITMISFFSMKLMANG